MSMTKVFKVLIQLANTDSSNTQNIIIINLVCLYLSDISIKLAVIVPINSRLSSHDKNS